VTEARHRLLRYGCVKLRVSYAHIICCSVTGAGEEGVVEVAIPIGVGGGETTGGGLGDYEPAGGVRLACKTARQQRQRIGVLAAGAQH
jgi:hypothetical protein